jgi:hemerythrin-like metal-binding protein
MDKEQELLAASRLAFELTKLGRLSGNLDALLARLYALLASLPEIRVLPHSTILLYSPRHVLIPVAQFGLPSCWLHRVHEPQAAPATRPQHDRAFVCTPAAHRPALSIEAIAADAPCFFLPLHDEDKPLGQLLMQIEPDWQPTPIEVEFMTDLSDTLSMLVSRNLVNQTLRVREVELEDARTDAIRRLGAASEYRDNETGMHVMRMTHFATSIAKALGLSEAEREILAICAPMHDVGKIGISDAILLKPGRLTSDEYEIMKSHTEIGCRLLAGEDALISAAREIASSHHERWDGAGYPQGLAGEAIPILARICSIADVFDALTSCRPYKQPWDFDEAVAYVRSQSGSYFDPAVVEAFDKALPEITRIRELYRDDIINPNEILKLPPPAACDDVWIAWDPSLSVGIDTIDEHHRYLFDLTNELFDAVVRQRDIRAAARIFKALNLYAQVHFRAEERMMEHYAYRGLSGQRHRHRGFEMRLRDFYEELHENPLTATFDALFYLHDWLIRHIRVEDAQLRELVAPA